MGLGPFDISPTPLSLHSPSLRRVLLDDQRRADEILLHEADAELDSAKCTIDYTSARGKLADSMYVVDDVHRRLRVCRERGLEAALGLDAAVRNSARADAETNLRINDARMLGQISRDKAIDHEVAEVDLSNQQEIVRCLTEKQGRAETHRAVLEEGVCDAQVARHQARRAYQDATDELRVLAAKEIDAHKTVLTCQAASISAQADSQVLKARANLKRKVKEDAENGYKLARRAADDAASVATHADQLVKVHAHAETENRLSEGRLRSDLLMAVENTERNWGGLMIRRGLLAGAHRRESYAHLLVDAMT